MRSNALPYNKTSTEGKTPHPSAFGCHLLPPEKAYLYPRPFLPSLADLPSTHLHRLSHPVGVGAPDDPPRSLFAHLPSTVQPPLRTLAFSHRRRHICTPRPFLPSLADLPSAHLRRLSPCRGRRPDDPHALLFTRLPSRKTVKLSLPGSPPRRAIQKKANRVPWRRAFFSPIFSAEKPKNFPKGLKNRIFYDILDIKSSKALFLREKGKNAVQERGTKGKKTWKENSSLTSMRRPTVSAGRA